MDGERRTEAALAALAASLAAERRERLDSERRAQAAEDRLRFELTSLTDAEVDALSESVYAEYAQRCKVYNVRIRGKRASQGPFCV